MLKIKIQSFKLILYNFLPRNAVMQARKLLSAEEKQKLFKEILAKHEASNRGRERSGASHGEGYDCYGINVASMGDAMMLISDLNNAGLLDDVPVFHEAPNNTAGAVASAKVEITPAGAITASAQVGPAPAAPGSIVAAMVAQNGPATAAGAAAAANAKAKAVEITPASSSTGCKLK